MSTIMHGLKGLRIKMRALLITSLTLTILSHSTVSLGIGMPDIGGLLVGQALNEIDAKLQQMQANAQSGINVEEGAAYQTLMNTSSELRSELQDSINQNMNAVHGASIDALRALYSEVDNIGDKVNGTIYTSEAAATNLRTLLPFSSMPFIIYGQTPDIFDNAEDDGKITIMGNGFGLDDSEHKYTLVATVAGQPVKTVLYPNRADILIPQSVLQSSQKDSGVGYVSVDLNATITQSCYIVGHCKTDHSAHLSIPIAPKTLATGVVQVFIDKDEPGTRYSKPYVVQTPEMSGIKSCVVHTQPVIKVLSTEMVTSAEPSKPNGCSPMRECLLSLYSNCNLIGDTAYQCSSCDEGPAHQMLYTIGIAQRVPTGHQVGAPQNVKMTVAQNTTLNFPEAAAAVVMSGMTWNHRAFSFTLYPQNAMPPWVPMSCSAAVLVGAGNRQMNCQGFFQ